LNAIRILSIISLLLVLSSNIVTLSNDIKAVNHFMETGKSVPLERQVNGTTTFIDPSSMAYIE